jgi:cell division septation protein DedD
MVHLYLQQLLEERKVVIVPELGQFTLIESPSTFDAESGQFHPAVRTIVFDESKRFEPSDFVNSVAEAENTTVDSVLHAIRSLIYDLRKNITESGQYHLKGLGNFLIDDRFNLTFVQSEEPNFDSFGLPDIEIIAINREDDFSIPEVSPADINTSLPIEEITVPEEKPEVAITENLIDLPIPSILFNEPIIDDEPEEIQEISPSVVEVEPIRIETIAEPEELIAPSDEDPVLETVKNEEDVEPISLVETTEVEIVASTEETIEEDDEDAKDPTLTWPVIMLMVLVVVISGFGIYYYMNYVNPASENLVLKSDTTKTDTLNTTIDTNLASSEPTSSDNLATNIPVEEPKPAVSKPEPAKQIESPKPEKPAQSPKPEKTEVKPQPVAKPESKPELKPIPEKSARNFKVVAGAFGVEENAIKLVALAKEKGYDASIIPFNGGKVKFKVAIGIFATEAEANALKVKAQTDFNERLLIMK